MTNTEEYISLEAAMMKDISPLNVVGVSNATAAHMIYSLCKKKNKQALVVTSDILLSRRLFGDLKYFFDQEPIFFPEREFNFFEVDAITNDVFRDRITALDRIVNGRENAPIVTTITALACPVPHKKYFEDEYAFQKGEICDIHEVADIFVSLGYTRVAEIEGRGQFSIRGGIIDFFPCSVHENPYRVELFDDEIESIRTFDVMTQRSLENVTSVRIVPAVEIPLEADTMERIKTYLAERTDIQSRHDLEKLTAGTSFPNIDKYIPLIFKKERPSLLDYAGNCIVFVIEPGKIQGISKRAEMALAGDFERFNLFDYDKYIESFEQVFQRLSKKTLISLSELSHVLPEYQPKETFNISAKMPPSFNKKIDFFLEAIAHYTKNGYAVTVLASSEEKAKGIAHSISENGFNALFEENKEAEPQHGIVAVKIGVLSAGIEYPLSKQVIISDSELFGSTERLQSKRLNKKNHRKVQSFTDLQVGDYVVHQSHGIGKFVGIRTMTISGAVVDYIELRYRGEDKLFIPTHQMDLIYKYVGKEISNIKLNKLGGMEWSNTKQRVKKACRDMADQLITLYSARQNAKGIEFSPDKEWQAQFEANFPYAETDDQVRCIEEVKRDMECSQPMDRLLCGDVGYGKTEVALRATFKAIADGYQVAYLVPTTILANQHYNTFLERMKDFPIGVELLSRFRSPKQQRETLKRAVNGDVDVIIGTHRLLQKDINFKKLGLLIVDEEQRFGVAHKERIKEMKNNIDVLTLTATPIPRTLHMSLIGVRDMSIIEHPPKDRFPVTTYVMEHNDEVINDAIIKEVGRGGQVYYLHNRVQSIFKLAARLAERFPDLRIGVAHGKMNENELEDVVMKFLDKSIDVLVCTTIIETGIDIANVNTIIIEDSDRFGLSQLYQLRGRVGRSNRMAYAYLTYRKSKVLSEDAEKRLKAIKEFAEFGAGFKIAMRDLEIRGAGNMIGAQQHGHMDAVGYDLYCKLLSDAVAEGRGETLDNETQTSINIGSAFIPKEYIVDEKSRIEVYKQIAMVENELEAMDMRDELADRYGKLPNVVVDLIDISLIRKLAGRIGISEITQRNENIVMFFEEGHEIPLKIIAEISNEYKNKILFSAGARAYLTYRGVKEEEKLSNIKALLEKFIGIGACQKNKKNI